MLRSSAWVFGFKLLVAFVNFGTVIVLSRWVSLADRGICSFYLFLIAISLVFTDLVAGPTIGYLMKKHSPRLLMEISYWWAAIVSLAFLFVAFTFGFTSIVELVLIPLLCWLNAANALHQQYFLGKNDIRTFNMLSMLSPVLVFMFICMAAFSAPANRLFYLVVLFLAWGTGFAAGRRRILRDKIPPAQETLSPAIVKAAFKTGFSNQLSHLSSLVNGRLIFLLFPAATLGIYANALSISDAMLLVPGSLGQVLYASRLNDVKKQGTMGASAMNLLVNFAVFSAFILFVWLVPDSFYTYFFGNRFVGIKQFLQILVWGAMFNGAYLICSYHFSGNGRFLLNFWASVAGLLVNVAWCFYQKHNGHLGLEQAVLGLCFSFVTTFAVAFCLMLAEKNGRLRPAVNGSGTELAGAVLPDITTNQQI